MSPSPTRSPGPARVASRRPAGGADAGPAGPGARPLRQAALWLLVLWAALFAPQLAARQVFVLGDARVYPPFGDFSRQRWEERHVRTFWNPYVFCGISASASLADMRPQYLPDAALDLVERLRPAPLVPLAAPLLAHLLGMLATAALAWALWRLPAAALVWAGTAWGLTPLMLVPFAFGHTAFFVACSLLPVEMLAVQRLFAAGAPLAMAGATLALAGVAGVQSLTGHPQVVVYSGLAALAFAVERAVRARRLAPLACALGALAWGAAISAAVWWPALLYGEHSNRGLGGVPLEQVRRMSVAWYELVTLAWPAAVGSAGDTYWGGLWETDYPRFLGTLVVAFAAVAVLSRRRGRAEGRGFLLGLALVPVAFALGPRLGPVFTALFHALPFFSMFRVTSMGLVVAAFAAALLSASTLAPPGEGPPPRARRWPAWLAAGLLVAACALGVALAGGALDDLYERLATAARPRLALEAAWRAGRFAGTDLAWRAALLGAALLLLGRWRARGRLAPAAGALLVLLLVADLAAVSLPTLRRGTAPPSALRHPVTPELARIGAAQPRARVLSLRTYDVSAWQVAGSGRSAELRVNDWIRWRAHAYGGEHGTPPLTWGGLELIQSVAAMRALGIVYISSVPGAEQDTAAAEPVLTTPQEAVYRLRGALGRAYAVPRVVALRDDPEVFKGMLADGFEPARAALTTEAAAAGDYPGSAACRLRWLEDEPDTLALEASAPAPAFVVVADAFFPGWSATVDGRPAALHRVDQMLRGVAVPAGTHELRMAFVPEGWRSAVPVTRAALGAWLVAVAAWAAAATLRRGRPRPAPASRA